MSKRRDEYDTLPRSSSSSSSRPVRHWTRLRSILPHVLTALVSVLVSVVLSIVVMGLQTEEDQSPLLLLHTITAAQMHSSQSPQSLLPTAAAHLTPPATPATTDMTTDMTNVTTPSIVPATGITPLPLPSLFGSSPRTQNMDHNHMDQELQTLQHDVETIWSAYYLSRAANQLADAETALHVNNLSEVEPILVTVGISLDRAYQHSREQHKGPISEFRMQVGKMREELYIRPEHMDERIRRLRQSMLSLVDR